MLFLLFKSCIFKRISVMTDLDAPALHEKKGKSFSLYNLHWQHSILIKCAVAGQIKWLKHAKHVTVKTHHKYVSLVSLRKCCVCAGLYEVSQ